LRGLSLQLERIAAVREKQTPEIHRILARSIAAKETAQKVETLVIQTGRSSAADGQFTNVLKRYVALARFRFAPGKPT
jgi:hypothetical protein